MLQRKVYRLARKIVYQVDVAIEASLNNNAGNLVTISADHEWDSSVPQNQNPVKDILDAVQELRTDGIDALSGNGYIVVNGQDYTNIISNTKVLNHPTYDSKVMANGQVGHLLGLTIVISEAVTADQAYVLVAKQGMVWKQAQALITKTIVDAGKSTTIRAWERGVFQLQVENEVCIINNTRA